MITTREVLTLAIIGATIVGGLAVRECGKVNSIQPPPKVVVASKPHFPGCHDSTVVVSVDTKVECEEGAEQTIEFWVDWKGNTEKWPMTVKCRCP